MIGVTMALLLVLAARAGAAPADPVQLEAGPGGTLVLRQGARVSMVLGSARGQPTALTTNAQGEFFWGAAELEAGAVRWAGVQRARMGDAGVQRAETVVHTSGLVVDVAACGQLLFTAERGVGIVRYTLEAGRLSASKTLVPSAAPGSPHWHLDVDVGGQTVYFVDGDREDTISACSFNGTDCRAVVVRPGASIADVVYDPRDGHLFWVEFVAAIGVSLAARARPGPEAASQVEELTAPAEPARFSPLEIMLDPSAPGDLVFRALHNHAPTLLRCAKLRCDDTLKSWPPGNAAAVAAQSLAVTLGGAPTLLPAAGTRALSVSTPAATTRVVCSANRAFATDRSLSIPEACACPPGCRRCTLTYRNAQPTGTAQCTKCLKGQRCRSVHQAQLDLLLSF